MENHYKLLKQLKWHLGIESRFLPCSHTWPSRPDVQTVLPKDFARLFTMEFITGRLSSWQKKQKQVIGRGAESWKCWKLNWYNLRCPLDSKTRRAKQRLLYAHIVNGERKKCSNCLKDGRLSKKQDATTMFPPLSLNQVLHTNVHVRHPHITN